MFTINVQSTAKSPWSIPLLTLPWFNRLSFVFSFPPMYLIVCRNLFTDLSCFQLLVIYYPFGALNAHQLINPTIDKFPFLQPLWSWKKSKNICVKSHGISDFHFFIFEKGDKHHFIIVWKNTVGPKFFLTSQKAFMTKGNSPMFGLIKKIVHFTA